MAAACTAFVCTSAATTNASSFVCIRGEKTRRPHSSSSSTTTNSSSSEARRNSRTRRRGICEFAANSSPSFSSNDVRKEEEQQRPRARDEDLLPSLKATTNNNNNNNEMGGEEFYLPSPKEIIERLSKELEEVATYQDEPPRFTILEFFEVCKEYVEMGGDVDELTRTFADSERNNWQFVEHAFDVVYESTMSKRDPPEKLAVYYEIALICARALRERITVPEVFLAEECIREVSQSRSRAKRTGDETDIERARDKVRKMMLDAFFFNKNQPSSAKSGEKAAARGKKFDFAKFTRHLSTVKASAQEDIRKGVSFGATRMGFDENIVEAVSAKVVGDEDDLSLSRSAYERAVNASDEVLALALELDIHESNSSSKAVKGGFSFVKAASLMFQERFQQRNKKEE